MTVNRSSFAAVVAAAAAAVGCAGRQQPSETPAAAAEVPQIRVEPGPADTPPEMWAPTEAPTGFEKAATDAVDTGHGLDATVEAALWRQTPFGIKVGFAVVSYNMVVGCHVFADRDELEFCDQGRYDALLYDGCSAYVAVRVEHDERDGSFNVPHELALGVFGCASGKPQLRLADYDGDGKPELSLVVQTEERETPFGDPEDYFSFYDTELYVFRSDLSIQHHEYLGRDGGEHCVETDAGCNVAQHRFVPRADGHFDLLIERGTFDGYPECAREAIERKGTSVGCHEESEYSAERWPYSTLDDSWFKPGAKP